MRAKTKKVLEVIDLAQNPPKTPDLCPSDREFIINKGFDFEKYKRGMATLSIVHKEGDNTEVERAQRILEAFDDDRVILINVTIIGKKNE